MPLLSLHSECFGNKLTVIIDPFPAGIGKLRWLLQKGKSLLPTFLSLLPGFLDLLVGHTVFLGPLKGHPTPRVCKGTGDRWSGFAFMTDLTAGKGGRL